MLKIGLIGCGFMGAMHADCYKNIAGAELVALADIRPEKAAALAKGTNAALYGDGMELIENAKVDIIDICLPTFLHARYALAAMDKANYVFIEKPVTLTVAEGEALLQKQKETGCQVQIGQVIRFWDEYVELTKIVGSGAYGKVVNANFRRLSPLPTPVVLVGDMNAIPETAEIKVVGEALGGRGMRDVTAEAGGTFHGYGQVTPPAKIDYIFTDAPAEDGRVVADEGKDGLYYSDHFAIAATIDI